MRKWVRMASVVTAASALLVIDVLPAHAKPDLTEFCARTEGNGTKIVKFPKNPPDPRVDPKQAARIAQQAKIELEVAPPELQAALKFRVRYYTAMSKMKQQQDRVDYANQQSDAIRAAGATFTSALVDLCMTG